MTSEILLFYNQIAMRCAALMVAILHTYTLTSSTFQIIIWTIAACILAGTITFEINRFKTSKEFIGIPDTGLIGHWFISILGVYLLYATYQHTFFIEAPSSLLYPYAALLFSGSLYLLGICLVAQGILIHFYKTSKKI